MEYCFDYPEYRFDYRRSDAARSLFFHIPKNLSCGKFLAAKCNTCCVGT
ncbi:MAG: hypothetical protein RMM53_00145 [Bacteroidia bacterium]|nr:hypothetical protein [Bacteroidia bacterium]MDW8332604.1 hypothetical protein [Bacteroidia bacterium]